MCVRLFLTTALCDITRLFIPVAATAIVESEGRGGVFDFSREGQESRPRFPAAEIESLSGAGPARGWRRNGTPAKIL